MRSETAAAATCARPFVWLAATLGTGTLLGLAWGEGAGPGALAMAVALALGLGRLGVRGLAPRWTWLALLLACARGWSAHGPAPSEARLAALDAKGLRDEPVIGRWQTARDGRTGWIEPFDGEPLGAGHALLFEPVAAAPESGTAVAILPGSEVLPWARGPESDPGSRAARFAALAPVEPDELVRLAPPRGWMGARPEWIGRLRAALARARDALGARAASIEGPRSAGLLRALAIGEREGLAPERADLFRRTGTSHMLALSGWHVSLFALLVLVPATRRARRGVAGVLVRALVLGGFAFLAGAEKPVLRATLTFLLHDLAPLVSRRSREAPRRPDGLSFLGAAFALECVLDPGGIRTLSLALSYTATLGLVLGTGPLARALRGEATPELVLTPPGVLRILWQRLVTGLTTAVAASASAVLATLPLVWTTFGEFAPVGALVTLAALPPFVTLSLLAWIAAAMPWAGWTPLAEGGAEALYAVLALGDTLPGTPLLLPPRPLGWLVAAAAAVFVALRPGGFLQDPARRTAALLWGGLLLPWEPAPSGLELVALDVGHGSALVVRAPGLEALVFDTGSRDRRSVAREALLPLLARWDVGAVRVVLSHGDQDHASGLELLAQRVPIAGWWGASPAQGAVRHPHRWRAAAERISGRAGFAAHPDRMDLAPGRLEGSLGNSPLRMTLLRGSTEAGNEGSRALELLWGRERLLLLGDAEEGGLTGLSVAPGPLRLLLAPHHGSQAAGLRRILERCPPEEVWISGSAEPAIAPELERRALVWRWTGRDGPLALCLP